MLATPQNLGEFSNFKAFSPHVIYQDSFHLLVLTCVTQFKLKAGAACYGGQ